MQKQITLICQRSWPQLVGLQGLGHGLVTSGLGLVASGLILSLVASGLGLGLILVASGLGLMVMASLTSLAYTYVHLCLRK